MGSNHARILVVVDKSLPVLAAEHSTGIGISHSNSRRRVKMEAALNEAWWD